MAENNQNQQGTGGSAYLDRSYAWTSFSKTVGTSSVVRPLIDTDRVYSQAITSGTTGSYLTDYDWTVHSGTIALETMTVKNPAVATGDFHRPEHLLGWKTLLPIRHDEAGVVDYLRSRRPAYLIRMDAESEQLAA